MGYDFRPGKWGAEPGRVWEGFLEEETHGTGAVNAGDCRTGIRRGPRGEAQRWRLWTSRPDPEFQSTPLLPSRATLSKLGTLCAPDDGVFTRRVVVGVRGADTPAWGRGQPAGFSWCFYPPCPARRQEGHSRRGRASGGLRRRRGQGWGARRVGRPPYRLPGRGWEGSLAPPVGHRLTSGSPARWGRRWHLPHRLVMKTRRG